MQATTRRRVISTAAAATGAVALAGCGGVGVESTTTANKGPVKLSFLTNWTGGTRTEIMDQSLAEFRRLHPQITLEPVSNGVSASVSRPCRRQRASTTGRQTSACRSRLSKAASSMFTGRSGSVMDGPACRG
jgi:hypothetical protein